MTSPTTATGKHHRGNRYRDGIDRLNIEKTIPSETSVSRARVSWRIEQHSKAAVGHPHRELLALNVGR